MSASVPSVKDLSVKIFADGADRAGMLEMARLPYIAGFTTNPTLMRKAGVTDYERFAREIPEKALADRQRPSQVFSRNRPDVSRRCG